MVALEVLTKVTGELWLSTAPRLCPSPEAQAKLMLVAQGREGYAGCADIIIRAS
jgi:hypothetical protein